MSFWPNGEMIQPSTYNDVQMEDQHDDVTPLCSARHRRELPEAENCSVKELVRKSITNSLVSHISRIVSGGDCFISGRYMDDNCQLDSHHPFDDCKAFELGSEELVMGKLFTELSKWTAGIIPHHSLGVEPASSDILGRSGCLLPLQETRQDD